MCTIFSALTLFTATAVLPNEIKAQADEFYQQHCTFAPERSPSIKGLLKWKYQVLEYVCKINKTSRDNGLVSEFLLYLASTITGNIDLQSIKVSASRVIYCPDMGKVGSIILDVATIHGQIIQIII